ncbi:N-acylglucosamine-6-phosphate 2-epimerase [Melghiribacillus thermohalophilus]|uniref:Putative N-acetylmannosamine-6-phosphate 2-epimerase n=1 Tax=Melghiribacillus thermohalophilus TaxID=1324956 RepID=A0A4R3N122_9BACI|nr:N-acetylmannosamine-6-phosphate 2-epimerase [Melghiribacillus thermohalophilus]TCT21751.1 N-acylglucosamine-6-phosphate 2-epimerase [Melghiribacillus thermohalophilus]
MNKQELFQRIKGSLIVSCQALEGEPLHGSDTMAKMALAAEIGGAAGLRANGCEDIKEIQKVTKLPIIGLIKQVYPDSDVYITPTKKEIDQLIHADIEMLALDCTDRYRPGGEKVEELVQYAKERGQTVMADVSTYEEGLKAERLGFDCVSTTLSGYTSYSVQNSEPDFELVRRLGSELNIPVIAEGKIRTPEQAREALRLGAHAVVVGSAITRPQEITKRFVKYINRGDENGSR